MRCSWAQEAEYTPARANEKPAAAVPTAMALRPAFRCWRSIERRPKADYAAAYMAEIHRARDDACNRAQVSGLLTSAVGIAMGVALVLEVAQVLQLAAMLAPLPLLSDTRLFFSMARGWLNGLVFYADLFETKPPLVFLLAALSLKLGEGNLIYNVVGIALLGLLSPVLGCFSYFAARDHPDRWMRAGLSVLLGLAAAGYTLRWTSDFQAEGFGLLFAVLPSLMIGRGLRWDVAAGVSLGLAVMVKEPFGVAGTISMLVFCHDRRVVRVLAVAAATCLSVLVFARAIVPYFTIYLPEMFTGRSIASTVYTHYGLDRRFMAPHPLWLRSFNAYRIFTGFGTPVANVGLGLFFFTACCVFVNSTRLRLILYASALLGVSLLASHTFDVTEQLVALIHLQGQSVPWGDPIMVRLLAQMVIPPLIVVGMAWRLRPQWSFHKRFLCVLAALFITSALVDYGGGNYDHRYLVFALPFLLAVSVACIIRVKTPYLLAVGGFLVLNSFIPGRYTFDMPAKSKRPAIQESLRARTMAEKLDALLADCQFERYFAALDTLSLQAYTKHSPYDLNHEIDRALGGIAVTASTQAANAYFANKVGNDLERTPVVVLPSHADVESLPSTVRSTVQKMTTSPPPCARPYLPITGLTIFFRK